MRLRSLVFALVLVVAIGINVVQFRSIDAATVWFFRAVYRADTADITALMRYDCAWCRERYDMHLALAVVAPDTRIIIPTPSRYAESRYAAEELTLRLRTFGQADKVNWVEYPSAANLLSSGDFDPTPYVIASGAGGDKGAPWALAVDPTQYPSDTAPDDFVDHAMTGEATPGPPGRTFVLLRWERARPDSEYSFQDLAVELSLLPEPVRRELSR